MVHVQHRVMYQITRFRLAKFSADLVKGGNAYSAIVGEGNAHNNTVVLGENAKVSWDCYWW